ncbi:MAG: hypothetical protein Q7S31_02540 [bacterium]|nr:hypothetical protein [bacterium]
MAPEPITTAPSANRVTVIELSRDKLAICRPTDAEPATLQFPPTIINDLEVINPAELEVQIKTFASQQQIAPTSLIVIISAAAYFEMDVTAVAETDLDSKIQEFLDATPLQSVSYKIFKVDSVRKLIVINRHYYEIVKRAFESLGFTVLAVIPEASLVDAGVSSPLTGQGCRLLLHKIDYIKQNSFIAEVPATDFTQKRQRFVQTHKTMLGLLSVMFIAFGLAMGVVVTRRPTNSPASAFVPTPRPASATPPPPAASPSANLSQFSVMIINSSQETSLGIDMERILRSLGLVQIQITTAAATTSQTLVVFSPSVTTAARNIILEELSKTYPALQTTENSQTQYDITITLGQKTP